MFSQKVKEELRKLKHDRILMLKAIQRLELLLEGPDPVLDLEACERYQDEFKHLEDDINESLRDDSKWAFFMASDVQCDIHDTYQYRALAKRALDILRYQRRTPLRKDKRFPLRTLCEIIF